MASSGNTRGREKSSSFQLQGEKGAGRETQTLKRGTRRENFPIRKLGKKWGGIEISIMFRGGET